MIKTIIVILLLALGIGIINVPATDDVTGNKPVTIIANKEKLSAVFKSITEQAAITIKVDTAAINEFVVTMKMENVSWKDVMDEICQKCHARYKNEGNVITVFRERLELPESIYEALCRNELEMAMGKVVTEDAVKEITARYPNEKLEMTDREFAERCKNSMKESFIKIRKILDDGGFDFKNALLISITTKTKSSGETKEVPFADEITEDRIDIFLTIISGEQKLMVKIDDCWIVGKSRMIGNGVKIMRVKGLKEREGIVR